MSNPRTTDIPSATDSSTDPSTDASDLGWWSAVRLVAGRELTTRLRSKAFRISTILVVVVLVGSALVLSFVRGATAGATVGLTGPSTALAAPLRASAQRIGETVTTSDVPDQATGVQQVRDGKLDALLVDAGGGHLRVVVHQNLDTNLQNALNVLAGQVALDQQISTLGGHPAQVSAAVAAARVDVEALQPPHHYKTEQLLLGLITGILIYLSLMLNGQAVAQGVVEEKSSRVVELLLATIRPWQLMAGKVAGIGAVGLIQVVIVGVVGVTAGLVTGALHISVSAAASTVIWLVVWYLLGFLAYALAFAAVGALVSRQEDIGGVISPVMMFVVVGYVLGVSILPSDPSNHLVEILSIIPMFAPTLMPMRLAMGGVPAWEAGLAVVLIVMLIPALVWLAGRIYRNAVMRTGARVRLRDALRAS